MNDVELGFKKISKQIILAQRSNTQNNKNFKYKRNFEQNRTFFIEVSKNVVKSSTKSSTQIFRTKKKVLKQLRVL